MRRYNFYFRVITLEQYFMNESMEWVKYFFEHKKIKFIPSSPRVIFYFYYIWLLTKITVKKQAMTSSVSSIFWKIPPSGPGGSLELILPVKHSCLRFVYQIQHEPSRKCNEYLISKWSLFFYNLYTVYLLLISSIFKYRPCRLHDTCAMLYVMQIPLT